MNHFCVAREEAVLFLLPLCIYSSLGMIQKSSLSQMSVEAREEAVLLVERNQFSLFLGTLRVFSSTLQCVRIREEKWCQWKDTARQALETGNIVSRFSRLFSFLPTVPIGSDFCKNLLYTVFQYFAHPSRFRAVSR